MGSTLWLGGCVRVTIAARQSHLARHQAFEVAEALKNKNSNLEIEFHFRESMGDKNLQNPLWEMPERGVFTEDFVAGLLNREFDIVVHSWKDLPVETREGLELIACLPRADQRDLLLIKKSSLLKDFSENKLTIFSSSPRRIYNLKNLLPSLLPLQIKEVQFQSVRGNIPTRIRKMLESEGVDGLVLAKAALDRLMSPRIGAEWEELRLLLKSYLAECEWLVLPLIENPTAAAQGAIVIESLEGREDLKQLFKKVNCYKTFSAVEKERQTLKKFGGGCHLALGISVINLSTPNENNFQKETMIEVDKNPSLTNELLSLRGQTPEGLQLNELQFSYEGPKFLLDEVSVVQEHQKIRKPIEINFQELHSAHGLFVSRFEAWPETYQTHLGQIIWTAGLHTWKKLAAKGVWVHGTSESLGYGIPNLDFLGSNNYKKSFLRLTHADAIRSLTDVGTYQIIDENGISIDENKKIFFWKSGKMAEKYFKKFPWLKNKFHATGFGESNEILKELIGNEFNKLFLFLNSDEFLKTVVRH